MQEVGPDGLLLIHYSGHGFLDSTGDLYLATLDTEPNVLPSAVAALGIHKLRLQHRIKRLILCLDCCFAGAATEGIRATASARLQGFAESKGVYVLAACRKMEVAQEDEGHGYFTKYLIEGIEGGAAGADSPHITVGMLHRFVAERLARHPRAVQTPQLSVIEQEGSELVVAARPLPGAPAEPLPPDERWKILYRQRIISIDAIGFAYVLDPNYRFVDWSACFDAIIARPLQLRKGEHVSSRFLASLANWTQVYARSQDRFQSAPLADTERLVFESDEFGTIVFWKIAAQLPSRDSGLDGWLVTLVPTVSEGYESKFWELVTSLSWRAVNWTRYAGTYDRVIGGFSAYQSLEEKVAEQVRTATKCLDLGAGTGNTTARLLDDPNRIVHAVDSNGAMLIRLQDRIDQLDADGKSASARVKIFKDDAISYLREIDHETYDACVMVNVLYSMDDPEECLREIRRVLRNQATLVMTTSRKHTDIHRLFDAIRSELIQNGSWDTLKEEWADAYERNKDMEEMICRHSIEEISDWLDGAGFKEVQIEDGEYVNCVAVFRATKRRGRLRPPPVRHRVVG